MAERKLIDSRRYNAGAVMTSDTTMRDGLRHVFAGRQTELERIAAALAHRDVAGVALIGAEGVGKSRLLA